MRQDAMQDVVLLHELRQIIRRVRARGDEVVATILSAAVNTIDLRLDPASGSQLAELIGASRQSAVEVEIELFGAKRRISVEPDFWAVFRELCDVGGLLEVERLVGESGGDVESAASRALRQVVLRRLLVIGAYDPGAGSVRRGMHGSN